MTAGQFGAWAPIGAEPATADTRSSCVREHRPVHGVATDGSGNWLSQSPRVGIRSAVAALEPSFAQDLNGSGAITPTTVVEAEGATSLVEIAGTYFLYPDGGLLGPQLRYGGAAVTAGQFGTWAPIAAEQAAGGYQVAWQFGTADQYTVWTTDGSGN